MNHIFRGHVEKGKNILDEPERYMVHVASLEGKKTEHILRKSRETRSDRQNRYYWGVVVELLAAHCGYTPEEMHDALKIKFLSPDGVVYEDGFGLIKVSSSARLKVNEFIQYTNDIVIWAAQELQVYIPDPTSVEF
jgi:hypothetical protein